MSWSTSASNVPADEVRERLTALEVPSGPSEQDEMKAQLRAAVAAAVSIVESGVVGAGPFSFSLSGHAEPGHEDRPGYSSDVVYLNVVRNKPQG
jgi:hypothetical protein